MIERSIGSTVETAIADHHLSLSFFSLVRDPSLEFILFFSASAGKSLPMQISRWFAKSQFHEQIAVSSDGDYI